MTEKYKFVVRAGTVYSAADEALIARLVGGLVSTNYGTFLIIDAPTIEVSRVEGARHTSYTEFKTPSGALLMRKNGDNKEFHDGEWYIDAAHVEFSHKTKPTYSKEYLVKSA